MAKFLGDIALVLELLTVCGGLLLLSLKGDKGVLVKVASFILIIGGITLGLCTSYHHFKYHFAGNYENAYPSSSFEKRGKHGKRGMGYWKDGSQRGRKIFRGDKKGRFGPRKWKEKDSSTKNKSEN